MNVLITKRAIILPQNEKLFQQLSDRRKEYSIHNGQVKTKLESKLDMRARGADSPDLADSVIMTTMTGWGGWPSSLAGQQRPRRGSICPSPTNFGYGGALAQKSMRLPTDAETVARIAGSSPLR